MRFTTIGLIAVLTSATVAGAQTDTPATTPTPRPYTLGIAIGAALPTGDLADGVNTGYNATGHIGLQPASLPIGFRLEASYNDFGVKKSLLAGTGANDASTRAFGMLANLVVPIPMGGARVTPYVIGGVGMYNTKVAVTADGASISEDENDFGFNAGGGLQIPFSSFKGFIEARYHRISLGNKMDGGSASFVPITLGISF